MVTVNILSEIATSREPARIMVYEGDKLVAEVTAEIHDEQGADGGIYSVVKLKKVPITP